MAYTYILLSQKDKRTYTGSTNRSLKTRYQEHKNGKVISTKNRLPIVLIYFENFKTNIEAKRREKYFKSAAGRRFIKNNIFSKK